MTGRLRWTTAASAAASVPALCPMNNIELQGGKPRWNGHCTHCMACISYCPKAAIAYGKKSRTRRIYTCPPYRPADR